jgi:hypothetical protein
MTTCTENALIGVLAITMLYVMYISIQSLTI